MRHYPPLGAPNGRHVMLVDDEEEILKSIANFMQMSGYEVIAVSSGQEALEAMNRRPVEVVVTDIRMPKMTGIDLLEKLNKLYPDTDVIILSGQGTVRDAIQALRLGALDYIMKPADLEELEIVLDRAWTSRIQKRELTDAREKLYQAQKMDSLSTLASGVAHEFNNLMGGVVGFAEMALSKDDNALSERALTICLQAGRRASEIARNLLRFAQRERCHRSTCQVNEVLRETLNLITKDLEDNEISVKESYDEMIPMIAIDEAQFQQVFLNLLINARDAINTPGFEATRREISVTTRNEDDTVAIEVSDSGSGVPQEKQAKIFEPFYTTKGVLRGGSNKDATGLGLSVVNGIVVGHGGSIDVKSAPTGGTIFTLHLPVTERKEPNAKRILICDDERDVRRIMRTILEKRGFEVEEAQDGDEALNMLRTTDYSLLFLDQRMPRLSGLELLEKLGSITNKLPVVMVTAVYDKKLAQESMQKGARDCLAKPLNTLRLMALAEKYCRKRGETGTDLPFLPEIRPDEKSLLVVDADPVVRDVCSLILRNEGYKVTTLGNARQALELTRDHSFDLILLDLSTRHMSEPGVIRSLRENNPYTPVVLSTTETNEESTRVSVDLGASSLMEKPVNPRVLTDQIRQVLAINDSKARRVPRPSRSKEE